MGLGTGFSVVTAGSNEIMIIEKMKT